MRPTADQTKEARDTIERWRIERRRFGALPGDDVLRAIETLLAATKPPTDEEIAEIVAEYHKSAFPGNPFACRATHQLKNLHTGDKTFTIAAVVGAIRHFFGQVKP